MIFGTDKATKRIEDRLALLADAVDDLNRANRKLDLEFTELYDKVRHQMSRMAKRDAAARKLNGDEEVIEEETTPFDHLDPISKSIMVRRGTSK